MFGFWMCLIKEIGQLEFKRKDFGQSFLLPPSGLVSHHSCGCWMCFYKASGLGGRPLLCGFCSFEITVIPFSPFPLSGLRGNNILQGTSAFLSTSFILFETYSSLVQFFWLDFFACATCFMLGLTQVLRLSLSREGWDGDLAKADWLQLMHTVPWPAVPFKSESCAKSGPSLGHVTLVRQESPVLRL